jgi:integrase
MVALGRDPQAERRHRRDKDRTSLRAVIEEYLEAKRPGQTEKEKQDKDRVRPKTYREITRYLTQPPYFKPLHPMPIDTVTRRDAAARLTAIKRHHGVNVLIKARAALNSFFAWALRQGFVDSNPVIGTEEPKALPSRTRTLSDAELKAIWLACRDDDFGRITKLCILLGTRREEIGGMQFSELRDLDGPQPYWELPAERSKNHRPLRLPLLPMALTIIRSAPKMASRNCLFGHRSERGFTDWGRQKSALDRRSGVVAWGLHDCRRTLSSRLNEMGVLPHVVEEVLGHVGAHRSGSAGVYNLAVYFKDKHAALMLWEDHLRTLIEGGERKVIPLPQPAAT